MSKKFLFGFAAFVCAALIFVGCPQEADDDPEPTAAEKAAKELGETLGGATVEGTTVTLTANFNVANGAPLAVPEGVTLVVQGGKTLGVTGTLDVTGTVSVAGTLNVTGTGPVNLDAKGAIEVSGAYQLGDGVTGTNNGTVTVKLGGVINNGADVNIGGSGTNIVEAGGTVYFDGDTEAYIGASDNTNALYRLGVGATFAYNNAGYTIGGGIVTLNEPGASSSDKKNNWFTNDKLHIKAGGQLTVADYNYLIIEAENANAGPIITGEPASGSTPAAKIVLSANNCKIQFYLFTSDAHAYQSSANASSGYQNFYDSSGAQTAGTLQNKNFTWNAAAGGASKPGWKADN